MAPLLPLLLAFLLASSVLASPHQPRIHAHRAVDRRTDTPSLPLAVRKRSLNRRCIPRPSNVSSVPSSDSPTPMNVAPVPSVSSWSSYPSSSSSSSSSPSPSPSPSPSSSSWSTTSSLPPAQTSSSSSSSGEPSFLTGTQTGQLTFYETGLGACGITNNDNDLIAAVSELLFDAYPGNDGNPNQNPVCNKQVRITYQGKSVTVKVTDRCTACKLTDLDLSPTAFMTLAAESLGRLDDATWVWL